jgi:hypothetical protein
MRASGNWLLLALMLASGVARAQDHSTAKSGAELRLHIISSLPGTHRPVPAVIWLTPLPGSDPLSFAPHGRYTLLQKNRTFIPHLQVIPVGSVVEFPNADPFFHNVFSLYEGKRFDLGLYEAGSSKSVTFPREGVSYIFCNIHPEMSAVILALSTPLYSIAEADDSFVLPSIPPGDYKLHFWIEGVPQSILGSLARSIDFASHDVDLGSISAPIAKPGNMPHPDKFGNPYDTPPQSTY